MNKVGIMAVDKTISSDYPQMALFLFEDERQVTKYLRLIRENQNYSGIELVEFDRIVEVEPE